MRLIVGALVGAFLLLCLGIRPQPALAADLPQSGVEDPMAQPIMAYLNQIGWPVLRQRLHSSRSIFPISAGIDSDGARRSR